MEKLVAGGNEDSSSDSEFGQWLALHMFHQPEIALACDKLGVMKVRVRTRLNANVCVMGGVEMIEAAGGPHGRT